MFHACRSGPLLEGIQIWENQAFPKFGLFWPRGPRWSNFTKILSLFNMRTSWPRASPASSSPVRLVPYSRVFKFGKIELFQNFVNLGL